MEEIVRKKVSREAKVTARKNRSRGVFRRMTPMKGIKYLFENFDIVRVIKSVSKFGKGRGGGPCGATTNALIKKTVSGECQYFIVTSEPE